ncbi:hypothetical protein [Maricaulis sp.]|uniref:hypothetical protein n=1 Tax=Maricaulis sp. TaxID=1486257 RepID=UPI00261A331F|nr:hypothetical protein [Maricaulis sp.]
MKAWFALPAVILLAACSGPDTGEPGTETVTETAPAEETAAGPYGPGNLATSEACLVETGQAALLDEGQTLLERGPRGFVGVSHALNGMREDLRVRVTRMDEPYRGQIEDASAAFFRAAGNAHDPTTDAVIYHRTRDGIFCTVVRSQETGGALVDAMKSVMAATDNWGLEDDAEVEQTPAEETPADEPGEPN